ncbi:MAG: NAD(P)-dependent oxidoreductase [Myxococcales bacterium]|nr:NAD(P)-dependent oxidoreductase [Myxococcales bacterium]
MSARRVLVTGATGFLGGAVAARLHAAGDEVTATGRDLAAGEALRARGLNFVAADLTDAAAVDRLCAAQTHVVHCAARAASWGPYDAFWQANVLATRHVAEATRRAGGHLVHISTPSIYVARRDQFDVPEDAPLPPPINHYAATKHLAELEVDQAHAAGLSVITLRPQAILGPGDTTLMPRILGLAARGTLPVIGDGSMTLAVTGVENAIDAIEAALAAPPAALGRKYNITDGEAVRLQAVLDQVFALLGVQCRRRHISRGLAWMLAGLVETLWRLLRRGEPPLTRYAVCLLGYGRTLDISAARRDLGYAPRVPLDETLARFADWWRQANPPHGDKTC